ncbi:hypothetical protein HHK36_009078 [Tetracentron sinense]|uniref:Pinin/SDK/MemA protein domain-containing protein n=1 Tax=Tetracentron sinense TaxID=13715 RepID=A0A834ZCD8_TETSI|nr:hypothetical protein HHK36_009078 [Tetracentron sinense]
MGSAAVEKTEEELRKEIEELHRQQWEITERLRDPRGLRRGGLAATGPRNFGPNGVRQRGFVRPADRVDSEDQPAHKSRLSSAVFKVEDGEVTEDADGAKDVEKKESAIEGTGGAVTANEDDLRSPNPQQLGGFRRDGNQRAVRMDFEVPAAEHVPRVLPKDQDPRLVNRNKRMLGQLLGTLEGHIQWALPVHFPLVGDSSKPLVNFEIPESSIARYFLLIYMCLSFQKFQKEDMHLSGTEAYMRRSNSLQRAEQRAREESERLRQQEREQLAEKRRRDMTLRARVAAKAEEKKLELLFLGWSEHHKKLCNFLRTKTEPPIFYLPAKPLDEDATLVEQQKEQAFLEWKTARREELSEYQKQIGEQYVANVETELERWQNARSARKANNNLMNLQETMDKELETHRLEHGPKTRKIPGESSNNDEDDVEDINVGEDDMMDDVLEVDDSRRADEAAKPEAGNASPSSDIIGQ